MLILSRKLGESFLIGENIEVFILDVQNDKIKVGINASNDVKIIRKELKEIERANLDSANSKGTTLFHKIKKASLNNMNVI
jgi:carbon storage regulator